MMHGPTPIDEVIAEIEALADDEVIAVVAPYSLTAVERARSLDDVQALVDELRRRGHKPIVDTRHTPTGDVFAISIDRGGER